MADFNQARKAYADARRAEETKRTELIRANELVKRLQGESEKLKREANEGSGEGSGARLQETLGRLKEAQAAVKAAKATLGEARVTSADALLAFAQFTDPTSAVERLPDDVPMALFPLRIETRSGIVGLGDATLNGRELSVASYLTDHVVPNLIGRDAGRIEDTWQFFYRGAYWRRGPVTMTAISAVDVALWRRFLAEIERRSLPCASSSCTTPSRLSRPRKRQTCWFRSSVSRPH